VKARGRSAQVRWGWWAKARGTRWVKAKHGGALCDPLVWLCPAEPSGGTAAVVCTWWRGNSGTPSPRQLVDTSAGRRSTPRRTKLGSSYSLQQEISAGRKPGIPICRIPLSGAVSTSMGTYPVAAYVPVPSHAHDTAIARDAVHGSGAASVRTIPVCRAHASAPDPPPLGPKTWR
jgi:hypothetical protein